MPDIPDTDVPEEMVEVDIELADGDPQTAPHDGTVQAIPPAHRLMVDGRITQVPARVKKGAVLQAIPLDPSLAAAQAASSAAVNEVIKQRRQPVMNDVTVKQPAARKGPPPRDHTVPKKPLVVRLGKSQQADGDPRKPGGIKPPASPLKVATIEDGKPMGDDVLGDDDAMDLATDLGGGPSDADVAHAKSQVKPA